MPLVLQPGVVTPEPPKEPKPQPRQPTVEAPFVTWTPADGDEVILSESSGDYILQRGAMGLDMAPEEQHETRITGRDGSSLHHARSDVREVMLPIRLRPSRSLSEREGLRRGLAAMFDRRRGAGVLKWQQTDGTARYLACTYARGLENSDDGHRGALIHSAYQVILRAHDPHWYGPEREITFRLAGGLGDFFPIPFTISPSTTDGNAVVHIDGELDVWPTWTLHGPMTTATLRNQETGKLLEVTPNIGTGEKLTIRMDPSTSPGRRFTRETGLSWWRQAATQFPVFWSLRPGDNAVAVTAQGTSSASSVLFHYSPRYLTA